MLTDTFLLIATTTALFIATAIDIKKREVPDLISYGLLILGIAATVLNSISGFSIKPLVSLTVYLAVFGLVSLSMYYLHQWGGGDAKLLIGLAAVFSNISIIQTEIPLAATILLNLLVCGALYGLIMGIWLATKNKKEFKQSYLHNQHLHLIKRAKIIAFSTAIPIAFLANIFLSNINLRILINIFVVFGLLYPYMLQSAKAIERSGLIKEMLVSEITPGEWVIEDLFYRSKPVYKVKPLGVDEKDIAAIKHAGIKKVLVKRGLPFVPAFLLSILITLTGKTIIFILL